MGLVGAPAGAVLPIDLKHLVPEAQAGQSSRRVGLHQLDEDALGGGEEGETDQSTGLMGRVHSIRYGYASQATSTFSVFGLHGSQRRWPHQMQQSNKHSKRNLWHVGLLRLALGSATQT